MRGISVGRQSNILVKASESTASARGVGRHDVFFWL